MNDPQEDLYQCVGYCQVDPASGHCLGCGRPSPAVLVRGNGETVSSFELPLGECLPADNRFPVDPLTG